MVWYWQASRPLSDNEDQYIQLPFIDKGFNLHRSNKFSTFLPVDLYQHFSKHTTLKDVGRQQESRETTANIIEVLVIMYM